MCYSTLWFSLGFLTLLLVPDSRSQSFILPVHYSEDVESQIYTGSGTIIFKFFFPVRDENLLVTNSVCDTPTTPSAEYCPLVYHLQVAGEILRPMITLLRTTTPSNEATRRFKCQGSITEEFLSFHSSEVGVNDYLNLLKLCPVDLAVISDTNFDYTDSFRDYYERGHVSYDTVYYTDSSDNKASQGAHAIMLNALNSAGYLHYLAERGRWQDAMTDCKNQLLPSSLITQNMLSTSLEELQQKLNENNYLLLIPKNEASMSAYFGAKFVDCTFYSSELLVRLKVPIKKQNEDFKRTTLTSIPFRHSFEGVVRYCSVLEFQGGKTFTFDKISKEFHESNCEDDNDYCFMDKIPLRFAKSCASEIFSSATDLKIIKYCKLECLLVEEIVHLPLFVKVGGTIYAAGEPNDEFTVDCPGNISETFNFPLEGALRIYLPCSCKLTHRSRGIIFSDRPCRNQLDVSHVQSIHFK